MRASKKLPWGVCYFLLVWVLVLLLPPLRRQPWHQTTPRLAKIFELSPDPNREEIEDRSGEPPSARRDWLQQEAQLVRSAEFSPFLARLMAVQARYPSENWMRAGILRRSTNGTVFDLNWLVPPRVAFYPKPKWLSRNDMETCIRLAQEGAKAEPDNAFFPLMEAIYELVLERYPVAWATLDRAATCERFQDYGFQEMWDKEKYEDPAQLRSWQERLSSYASVPLPHLSTMRNLGFVVNREAAREMNARRAGEALRRFENALTVGRGLKKDKSNYLSPLVGGATEAQTWVCCRYPRTWTQETYYDEQRLKSDPEAYLISLAEPYAAFAKRQGRPDLAAASLGDAKASARAERLILGGPPEFWREPVSPALASQGTFAAGYLARTAWIAAGIWALLCGFLFLRLPSPSVRVISPVGFVGLVVPIGFLAWSLFNGEGSVLRLINSGDPSTVFPGVYQFQTRLAGGVLAIGLLPFLTWSLVAIARLPRRPRAAKPERKEEIPPNPWRIGHTALVALGLITIGMAALGPDIWGGTILAWPVPPILAVIFVTGASAFVTHGLYHRFQGPRKPVDRVKWMRAGAHVPGLLRSVAGTVAVCSTVAYLGVVLAIWPSMMRMEGFVDELERRGQVGMESSQSGAQF